MKKKLLFFAGVFVVLNYSLFIGDCECGFAKKSIGEVTGLNSMIYGSNDLNLFPIDTMTIKYFPMAVGNVYKYHYASSSGYFNTYKVRIIKDTIINSKKYFVLSRNFTTTFDIIRMDTTTGNLLNKAVTGCPWSPGEYLVDSLRARLGDSNVFCYMSQKHYCTDTNYVTIFGQIVKSKTFTIYNLEGFSRYTYAMNFGYIKSYIQDWYALAGETLVGCYINGVLYGDTTLTNVNLVSNSVPEYYELEQNYPNPFNAVTSIKFSVPMDSRLRGNDKVVLRVFDLLGRELRTLVNDELNPGTYEVRFEAGDLPSGVYFYRMDAENFVYVRSMILIK